MSLNAGPLPLHYRIYPHRVLKNELLRPYHLISLQLGLAPFHSRLLTSILYLIACVAPFLLFARRWVWNPQINFSAFDDSQLKLFPPFFRVIAFQMQRMTWPGYSVFSIGFAEYLSWGFPRPIKVFICCSWVIPLDDALFMFGS